MKKEIHPEYFDAKVSCACGAKFVVPSNKAEIRIEVCSQCHPFYTGNEKSLDTAGRAEKFKQRVAKAGPKKATKKKEKAEA
ncbi:MAG TPA: 50S ribosomal protein L31 [Candidatus Paceibacterota bacterium]